MWRVIGFQSPNALQDFLNTNAIPLARVAAVYFDAASGQHILVYTP